MSKRLYKTALKFLHELNNEITFINIFRI